MRWMRSLYVEARECGSSAPVAELAQVLARKYDHPRDAVRMARDRELSRSPTPSAKPAAT
jgi:hypothetical protein